MTVALLRIRSAPPRRSQGCEKLEVAHGSVRPEARASKEMVDTRTHDYYDVYWRMEGWATRLSPELGELFARNVTATDRCLDVGCGDGGATGASGAAATGNPTTAAGQ